MKNIKIAKKTLEKLAGYGFKNYLLCPGSRNAPLIELITNSKLLDYRVMHEEREAAFYALQKIKSQDIMTAVVTTSGTAVAELLPAVIEAYYQSVPLVVISADRPKSYRGSGAPQTIEQAEIFKTYAESWDIENIDELNDVQWSQKKPLHINLCFDESLIDAEIEEIKSELGQAKFEYQFENKKIELNCQRPFFIVGQLDTSEEQNQVAALLQKYPAPCLLEALSNLSNVSPYELRGPQKLVMDILKEKQCDVVIRIGGIPTSSVWRRLEKTFNDIPVYSFTKYRFSGLARESMLYPSLNIDLPNFKENKTLLERIKNHAELTMSIVDKYPLSEVAMVKGLQNIIPTSANVYIGNSLPIRNFQYFNTAKKFQRLGANRGANGIDGQVASFLGFSKAGEENFAILGDQTLMYGESALHFIEDNVLVHIICINNGGGKIFRRMYENPLYQNLHAKNFAYLAKYHNLNYQLVHDIKDLKLSKTSCLYELKPDMEQEQLFWEDYLSHDY